MLTASRPLATSSLLGRIRRVAASNDLKAGTTPAAHQQHQQHVGCRVLSRHWAGTGALPALPPRTNQQPSVARQPAIPLRPRPVLACALRTRAPAAAGWCAPRARFTLVNGPPFLMDHLLVHALQQLECAICKELINNAAMISVCSHNFCSECIRGWLQTKQQCPICSCAVETSNLFPNRLIDSVIQALKCASPVEDGFKQSEDCTPHFNQTPSSFSAKVECPSCHSLVQEAEINKHLDCCLSSSISTFQNSTSTSSLLHTSKRSVEDPTLKRVLPNVVFSSAKDSFLKKILSKYNLPTHGKRPDLERRWKKFQVIFDANQDASSPLSDQDLVKKIICWERSLGNTSAFSAWGFSSKKRRCSTVSGSSHDDLILAYRKHHGLDAKNTTSSSKFDVEADLPDPWRKTMTPDGTMCVYYNPDTKVAQFSAPSKTTV